LPQSRHIEFGSAGWDYVKEWLRIRAEWDKTHNHRTDALLPVDKNRRLAEKGLTSLWRPLLEQAGIKRNLTPHSLRH
jgi:site-specific recombinase XerD